MLPTFRRDQLVTVRPTPCPILLGLLLLGTLLVVSPAAAATLTRGPYLQLLTTQSVTIVWKTDTAAACGLTIGLPGGPTTTITSATGTVCAIPVTGLSAGAAYGYVPLADGQPLRSESVFHTDDPTRPYTFLALGDSGCGCSGQFAVRDRMLATPADFILSTGDMIYKSGAAADFDPKFFRPYQDLIRQLVFWPTLGNHDVTTARGQPWRDAFYTPANNPARSENYYSFDYGNAHVVVLNSNGNTSPGSAQYRFLDQDLAASPALWKFVAFHHTIYSSGTTHGSNLPIRANLVPLFDKHGVDIVLMGHEHNYERTAPLRADQVVAPGGGTVYITTGGGGHDLYPVGQTSFTAYAESASHFTRVVVDGGTLVEQMIRVDGAVRDTMTLVKGSPPPPPRCGDNLVNQPTEQCDGTDRFACLGACTPDCTCAAACGDGHVNQPSEQCDGADDAACPGLCLSDCTCGTPARFAELAPVADTYIRTGTPASWDHGASDHLTVGRAPFTIAYLTFDLAGVPVPVTRATLTLSCIKSSPDGGTIYPVPDPRWIEGTGTGLSSSSAAGPGLKWTDVDTNGDGTIDARDTSSYVPEFTRPLAALGSVVAGQAATVDLTPAFQSGPRAYSLAIQSDSHIRASYASRENASLARRPRLRLELGAEVPATTTTSSTTTTSTTTTLGRCLGVVCTALDPCHVAGTCDPATGACSNPPKPDGTSCTDGKSCTGPDTCQSGVCAGPCQVGKACGANCGNANLHCVQNGSACSCQ